MLPLMSGASSKAELALEALKISKIEIDRASNQDALRKKYEEMRSETWKEPNFLNSSMLFAIALSS